MINIENIGKLYHLGETRYETLWETMGYQVRRMFSAKGPRQEKTVLPNSIWALKDVSFNIREGEVVGIIGRNGAGKSTLLKILSRITPPTVGRIRVRGRVASLLEVGTGFHPELTGRENIFMNGAVLGMSRSEIRRNFDKIVEFSEVELYIDTPVKRYSSGMYVRLAFAVAAHLEPEILVVDEVLAVGDIAFQKKCMRKIDEAGREGRTVIFVSHNLAAVSSLTTRSILLENGRLVANDSTKEVIKIYLEKLRDKAPETQVKDRLDRDGDGKARVAGISVKDISGNIDVLPLSAGQKQISIQIDCNQDVFMSTIALSILSAERQRILWMDSKDQIEPFKLSKGPHQITINMCDGICPLPGEYYLNIALVGIDGMIDYVADAHKFTIVEGDFFGSGKIPVTKPVMFIKHDWAID